MKIVVIYKWAADPQDAKVSESGEVDWGRRHTISEYDPVAIQVGRKLADEANAELIGVCVGESDTGSKKALQAAAARGLDKLFVVADDSLQGASADLYARVLASVITNIRDVDLIIAGEASADVGGKAVPGLLAGFLGVPSLAEVAAITTSTAGLEVQRIWGKTEQKLRLQMPAVLSVTTDATPIPLIGMKDMMAARKKPVEVLTLEDLQVADSKGETKLIAKCKPEAKARKNIIIDSESAATDLVAALREEGVIA